jgi:hypothetical protein
MASKKRNALKHGSNAKEVMLWSERYEDYESLRADLYLEFTPSGSIEEYLVRTLVDLGWCRRRLDCHDSITASQTIYKASGKSRLVQISLTGNPLRFGVEWIRER